MPLVSKPTVGSLVQLRIADQWWPTRLEEISNEALVLAWPTDSDRNLVPLEPGSPVDVLRVVRGDGTYVLTGAISECCRGVVPVVRVTPEGDWQRGQRRNAFRGSVAIRPRIADALFGSARMPLRLGITNVSATGVQVRSQDELRRGNLLQLTFPIGDDEIEVHARVMRVVKLERVWDAGCVFEGISERLSERIVQFIFAQQRVALRARRENQ